MKKYRYLQLEKDRDAGLGTLKRIHVFTKEELQKLHDLKKHEKVLADQKRLWAGENGAFSKKDLKSYYDVWDAHYAV